MLLAGLNYNSNLALAFAFLMSSMALVTMHHCNRNMLGLSVDATIEVDAFAGREAMLEFELRNGSGVDRRDIEVRCMGAAGMGSVLAGESAAIQVIAPGRSARRHPHQSVRTAHALSLWVVLFLDLRSGLDHRLRRAGTRRKSGAGLGGRAGQRLSLRGPRRRGLLRTARI